MEPRYAAQRKSKEINALSWQHVQHLRLKSNRSLLTAKVPIFARMRLSGRSDHRGQRDPDLIAAQTYKVDIFIAHCFHSWNFLIIRILNWQLVDIAVPISHCSVPQQFVAQVLWDPKKMINGTYYEDMNHHITPHQH